MNVSHLPAAIITVFFLLSACTAPAPPILSAAPTAEAVPESSIPAPEAVQVPANSTAQRQPEGASSFFAIEEVGLDPNGYVALHNFTDVPVTLDGLHLCQGESCFALPDEVVPPGQIAYVATGVGPAQAGVVIPHAPIGILAPLDGEVALYVTDPDDPENLVTYFQWGATPHPRTEAAVEAGLWLEGSYAPSGANAVRLFKKPDSGWWVWEAGE